jgi:DNA-binding IclR family transcriptional regulator
MTTSRTARDRPPEEAAEDTSFARGLRLLLTVADRGEVRADELSALLDTPVSTVYRYLRTLAEFGFVDRRGGRFRLGPRLLIGTEANVTSEELIRVADPVLRLLADETGETAMIVRRIGLSAVCLHQVESRSPLRVALEPGAMLPLHAGAASKVLLAWAPPEIVDEVVARGLQPLTPRTIPTDDLRAALAEIVDTGIARSEGELVSGSVAMAVPVFREDGIVGAIGVIGPAERCGVAWRDRVARALPEAAASVMASLGGGRSPVTS